METLNIPVAKQDLDLENLRNDAISFVYDLIQNVEIDMYNSLIKLNRLDLLVQNDKTINEIILNMHEDNFNKMYHHLCNIVDGAENDDDILNVFNKLQSYKNHSILCLINIIVNITLDAHLKFNRENLIITTIDKYIKSVCDEFNKISNTIGAGSYFTHNCMEEEHIYELPIVPDNEKQFNFKIYN